MIGNPVKVNPVIPTKRLFLVISTKRSAWRDLFKLKSDKINKYLWKNLTNEGK